MLLRSRDIQCSRSDRAAVRGQNRRGFLRRFARDEEGALLIFGVYVFLMILMIGGIGIDLMRVERDRAALQYTLDRAVLAAADLDQSWTAQRVINEYFNKAGLSDYLTTVTVDEGLGYRVVTGEATAEVKTQFMHMTGVDSLHAPASSTAEERIDGVEISLILDVSGSMNSNSRLTNLKVAARDFIDEMVANTEDGKLAISIIPYATQVSVPEEFLSEFNISREHSYSNCVNFQNLDFYDAGIPTSQPLEQTMHFDPWYTFDGRDNNPPELVRRPVCEAEPAREIMIMQKNAVALKDFITNLTARGNTSIDIGMKWGTALLDPTLQPVVDNMIAAGTVDAAFESLPRNYNDNEALKVIVL
ncbi:MAG: Flp pilus assembly protein TadG, partial [Paracoccaceae bacterium]